MVPSGRWLQRLHHLQGPPGTQTVAGHRRWRGRGHQEPPSVVPKGLRSYDEHDADFFLELLPGTGRSDRLPEIIHFWKARIEEPEPDTMFRVGLIYGPSGCGKSSLVKAGLLPRLSDPFFGSMSRQLPIKRSPIC